MSESELYTPIIEAVNASKLAKIWRNQCGRVHVKGGWMQLAPVGAPDLIGYARNGRFVGLEVKKPKQQATLLQDAWCQEIAKAGGIAGCVHSPGEAIAILQRALGGRT